MFVKYDPAGFTSPLEGIEMKTIVYGDKSNLTRFHLKAGSLLPSHSHPHEQTGFLISGKMELSIDGDIFQVDPGDCWSIKGGVEHSAKVFKDAVAIEVFSPLREDYLPGSIER